MAPVRHLAESRNGHSPSNHRKLSPLVTDTNDDAGFTNATTPLHSSSNSSQSVSPSWNLHPNSSNGGTPVSHSSYANPGLSKRNATTPRKYDEERQQLSPLSLTSPAGSASPFSSPRPTFASPQQPRRIHAASPKHGSKSTYGAPSNCRRQAVTSAILLCCGVYIYLACSLTTLDPIKYKYDHHHPPSGAIQPKPFSDLRRIKKTQRGHHPRVVALYDNQYNKVTTRVVSLHTSKHKQLQLELAEANQTSKAPLMQHNNNMQEQEEEYVDEEGNVQKVMVQVEDKADSVVQETSQDLPDKCQPMADWQTQSFVNCNSLHGIDMHRGITLLHEGKAQLTFLGQGWFRSTWQLGSDAEEPVVLKTLRLEREFLEEYYELHRRDAVAMEQLTHSPFVMNAFGYCGQSAVNELANFKYVTSLEALDRRLRGKGMGSAVLTLKLRLATSIAVGISHVHGVILDNNDATELFPAGMVHYDLNPRNIAITRGGKPKLNDFNIAEILKYDPTTNETCGFRSRLHEPWWRAPEEMDLTHQTMVNEKVDVYALGNILFHILTTHSPRGKMQRERMEEVRDKVRAGVRPELPKMYSTSKDPIVVAFQEAMVMCFEPDPALRATSREVADRLYKTLEEFKKPASDMVKHGAGNATNSG